MIEDSLKFQFVNKHDVLNILAAGNVNPIDKSIANIRIDKIEKELDRQHRIKKAECYVTPSGTIKIRVLQREPILRIVNNGRGYYIDNEGEIMPVSKHYSAFVPIATGAISEKFAKNELYDFALFLKRNEFWNAQI